MELSESERKQLIDPKDKVLSMRRQCEILEVNRSSFYYMSKPSNPFDIEVEKAIVGLYVKYPFYGHRKVQKALERMGFLVNIKKVQRIRKNLGLVTLYPKPNLSKPKKSHKKYPYLLKGLEITRVNQIWSTDISYIRLKNKGWIYITAVIDWYSRYILSFAISTSMEVDFCLEALEGALEVAKPEIFNSDQGSQFTSAEFLSILENQNIRISMDSVGRCLDNIRIERFWRSLKYEEVFLNEYHSVREAKSAIGSYIDFYNHERLHQSLGYYTPHEVYYGIEKVNNKDFLAPSAQGAPFARSSLGPHILCEIPL